MMKVNVVSGDRCRWRMESAGDIRWALAEKSP